MMAINEITDADIREYILGKSSAEKTEQLDELSFFDEYSDRISAAERELVDEYVNKSLSAAETLAFESHYLTSGIRRERVRFAGTLAKYSAELQPATVRKTEKASFFDLLRQRFFVLQLGAAAIVLILISIFAWVIFRDRSPAEIAQNSPTDPIAQVPSASDDGEPDPPPLQSSTAGNAAPVVEPRVIPDRPVTVPTPRPSRPKERPTNLAIFVLTPALRSASFQTIDIPSGNSSAEFRLRLETEDSGPIAAEIVDVRTQSKVWSSQKVTNQKGRSGSTASIQVPTRALKAGEYRITLSRATEDNGPEKVGDYFFRVAP